MSFPQKSNRRKLDTIDAALFKMKAPPVHGTFNFESKPIRSDARLKAAVGKAVATSPLLRSTVVGSGSDAAFVLCGSKKEWPKLVFGEPQRTDDLAEAKAKEFNSTLVTKVIMGGLQGDDSLQRIPLHIFAVRGETKLVVALVTPHHFMDAIAIASFIGKMVAYYLVPRLFWPLLDRRNPDSLPSPVEMVIKGDFGKVDPALLQSPAKPSPIDAFYFKDHNMFLPEAMANIRGIDEIMALVDQKQINECKAKLRASHDISLTSAFAWLALKTYASLLDKFNLNPDKKPLIYVTTVDPRLVGTWGDKRRDKAMRRAVFPAIANYAFTASLSFSHDEALSGSISNVGRRISDDVKRIRSDSSHRLDRFFTNISTDPELIAKASFCSVNSINVPRSILPPRLVPPPKLLQNISADFDMGPLPRIIFIMITQPCGTSIRAVVKLPIAEMTEADVHSVIRNAAAGTALESLLFPEQDSPGN